MPNSQTSITYDSQRLEEEEERERQRCSPDMSSTKQTLITQRQMLSDQTDRNEIMHEMK